MRFFLPVCPYCRLTSERNIFRSFTRTTINNFFYLNLPSPKYIDDNANEIGAN